VDDAREEERVSPMKGAKGCDSRKSCNFDRPELARNV
jgi:hypothetical protein